MPVVAAARATTQIPSGSAANHTFAGPAGHGGLLSRARRSLPSLNPQNLGTTR